MRLAGHEQADCLIVSAHDECAAVSFVPHLRQARFYTFHRTSTVTVEALSMQSKLGRTPL